MPYVHSFNDCLDQSHNAEDLPIWEEVYKKSFPDFVSMVSYRGDGFWQRSGIDRGVLLKTSKQILIDEKVRGRNKITGRVYDDIVLEYLSNDSSGALGWVCKPLQCDYIAYLIAPLGICYMLPVIQLQSSFSLHGNDWKKSYKIVKAQNQGYKTHSVAIPVKVLFKAIGDQLRINFEPFELVDHPENEYSEKFMSEPY